MKMKWEKSDEMVERRKKEWMGTKNTIISNLMMMMEGKAAVKQLLDVLEAQEPESARMWETFRSSVFNKKKACIDFSNFM